MNAELADELTDHLLSRAAAPSPPYTREELRDFAPVMLLAGGVPDPMPPELGQALGALAQDLKLETSATAKDLFAALTAHYATRPLNPKLVADFNAFVATRSGGRFDASAAATAATSLLTGDTGKSAPIPQRDVWGVSEKK